MPVDKRRLRNFLFHLNPSLPLRFRDLQQSPLVAQQWRAILESQVTLYRQFLQATENHLFRWCRRWTGMERSLHRMEDHPELAVLQVETYLAGHRHRRDYLN